MAVGLGFRCPVCETRLDIEGAARWVREAERDRDEAYLAGRDGERGERQREVYRRRKVLYDLRSAPHAVGARPEMILVLYDARSESYECEIFYKEPRPTYGVERVSVGAELDGILDLRSHPDPNVRLAACKIEEFHLGRQRACHNSVPQPRRRVFYSNEL